MKRVARINLAVVPAVLTALLAHLACPACWPAFAAALSWAGLSSVLSEKYLPPVTAVCLALALIALGYAARKQRRYGPLMLATFGAAMIVAGLLLLDPFALTIGGASVLAASLVWNSWPRAAGASVCAPCANSPSTKEERSNAIIHS